MPRTRGWLYGWVEWFPDLKTTVVVLLNAFPHNLEAGPVPIVYKVLQNLFAPEIAALTPKVNASVDPKVYNDYLGRYYLNGPIKTITTQAGHLYSQVTGQTRLELLPTGPDQFFSKETYTRQEFIRDATGAVVEVHQVQGDYDIISRKLKDNEYPELPPAALDPFVGQYQYAPNAVLSIVRYGDLLSAQYAGFLLMPLYSTSDHEFQIEGGRITYDFIRSPNGGVVSVVIRDEKGLTANAPKLIAPAH